MEEKNNSRNVSISRRSFLKLGGMTVAAVGLSSVLPEPVAKAAGLDTGKNLFRTATGDTPLQTRTLGSGNRALTVSAIGLGCMGMSHHRSEHPDKKTLIRLLHEAVDRGVTLFDTAESYGPWINEELVGEALHEYRYRVTVTTKFGHTFINGKHNIGVEDCTPANIRRVCEASLKRLRLEALPMFYQHRQDKNVPVEEVASTVADLIKEGKVLRFGLSEVNADTIRRAHAVCPVTAVQSEYHLMWREPEKTVFPVLEELGIGFVPYSPLTRGFLGGDINEFTRFDPDNDNRATHTQFTPEALRNNTPILNELHRFGRVHGMTSSQVALAWMLWKKPWVVPIPGTTKSAHLAEDIQTLDFTCTDEEWLALEAAVASHPVTGSRANSRDTSIQK